MIKIYSSPTCTKCKMLKSWCDRNSIGYEEVDITADSKAYALLLSEGKSSLPVVEKDGVLLSGEVKELTEKIK